jgi:hypothetical protein
LDIEIFRFDVQLFFPILRYGIRSKPAVGLSQMNAKHPKHRRGDPLNALAVPRAMVIRFFNRCVT